MAKAPVLKADAAESRNVVPIDRETLQEFPHEHTPGLLESADTLIPESLREALLGEMRAEAESRIQEAYTEAYQRGLLAGEEAFKESVGQAAQLLENAAKELTEARTAFLDSLEPQVVELATLIAEKVLAREPRTDPVLVVNTARRALTEIVDRQSIRLRVHPADYETLRNHQVTLLEEFAGIQTLIVEPDETIGTGGCVAESQLMQADARLDTLLSNVLEALLE